VPWRAGQVLLLGVGPRVLTLWQRLTLAEITFHHSNLRPPIAIESLLVRLIVMPRIHGIHHSVRQETNSNWSSEMGAPAYRDPKGAEATCITTAMPFRRQRPTRHLPGRERPISGKARTKKVSDYDGDRISKSVP
jgi:hypothetical protein